MKLGQAAAYVALVLVSLVVVRVAVYFAGLNPFISTAEEPCEPSVRATEKIPRIIHQTYKTSTVPEKFVEMQKTVLEHNAHYTYMFWTDHSMRAFIAANYSWFLLAYDSYRYPIQRVDTFRYFVLYHYGGIYLDLDIGAACSFDPILKYDCVLAETYPVGVSNDFMATRQGHPFMQYLIDSLYWHNWNFGIPYATVMIASGSLFVSIRFHAAPRHVVQDIRILTPAMYGTTLVTHMPNKKESTWHSKDAAWLACLYGNCGFAILIIIVLFAVFRSRIVRKLRGRKQQAAAQLRPAA